MSYCWHLTITYHNGRIFSCYLKIPVSDECPRSILSQRVIVAHKLHRIQRRSQDISSQCPTSIETAMFLPFLSFLLFLVEGGRGVRNSQKPKWQLIHMKSDPNDQKRDLNRTWINTTQVCPTLNRANLNQAKPVQQGQYWSHFCHKLIRQTHYESTRPTQPWSNPNSPSTADFDQLTKPDSDRDNLLAINYNSHFYLECRMV